MINNKAVESLLNNKFVVNQVFFIVNDRKLSNIDKFIGVSLWSKNKKNRSFDTSGTSSSSHDSYQFP